MEFDYNLWITYGLGLLVLYMLIRVFLVPLRYLLQVAYHLVVGGVVLFGINLVAGFFDYGLALNPLTALTVGYLGVPGVALLVALQHLAGVA